MILLRMFTLVAAFLYPLFATVQSSFAEQEVILFNRVLAPSPPQRVDYFLTFPDSTIPKFVQGTSVPARKSLIPTEGNQDWFTGAAIAQDMARTLESYAVLILCENGEYVSIPSQSFEWSPSYLGAKSAQVFQDAMKQWRTEMTETEEAIEKSSGQLRRLQADAELIARAERVIDVELRIQSAEKEMEGIAGDIESLKGFVQLAKQAAPPRNFARREIELTQQLKALAEATKQAEADEHKRVAQGEVELHNVQRVIEQTRFEDIEALRGELVRLRRYRQTLEGRGQGSADIGSAADYIQ